MLELSLSTVVKDDDLATATALLGGLCAMEPWRDLHHVLFFKGPTLPRGIAKTGSVVDFKNPRKDTAPMWKDLHQSLARQSSVLRCRYEVFRDRDFGVAVPNANARGGVLSWTDFPEPPQNARPWLAQRKKVEIWDQKNLPLIMSDNNYRYVSRPKRLDRPVFPQNTC